MKVQLAEPLPGCRLSRGYIAMSHVSSSSAGGFWELPRNVKAFLDTLAYAEGTNERYNYIFTHVTFESYADHPRKTMRAGKLYSTAAGRYQFLSTTWDGVAPRLGLVDFTPPSQEKAVLEIIRRGGAYKLVSKSSVYANFTAALGKLNGTWASLPGSPYGQPTHSTAKLWKFYKAALAKY
jgi:muramidase (phage lysozyme)